jgi:hypothetical protein
MFAAISATSLPARWAPAGQPSGRVALDQAMLAAIDLLRERAARIDELELELAELELEMSGPASRGRP